MWIISELYYPEETSTGHFITAIAEGLSAYYSVKILCAQPTYAARGSRAPRLENRNGAVIRRCVATRFNKDFLFGRIINHITLAASISAQAFCRMKSRDIVLVVTNPPILPYLIAMSCRIRGAHCLLLVHDVYPKILVAAGFIKADSLGARILDWFNRRLCFNVERIVVLGRDVADLFSRISRDPGHVVVIPNWADSNDVIPAPRSENSLLRQLKLEDRFVVQYSGNLGRTHGLDCLLEAVGLLRNRVDIHFIFIGWGAKKRWIETAIKKRGLENATLLSHRGRADLSNSLNACDVAIVSVAPGMLGASVPSRMYNILAAGKPIIAVTEMKSELARVVQEEHVGWVAPPGQPQEIAKLIIAAQENPKLLLEMGTRARQVAENKYTLRRAIESYRALVHSVECNR